MQFHPFARQSRTNPAFSIQIQEHKINKNYICCDVRTLRLVNLLVGNNASHFQVTLSLLHVIRHTLYMLESIKNAKRTYKQTNR